MVYYVYLLESPRWGDSNENTQYTFMFKKLEKRKNIPIMPPDLALWLTLICSNFPCPFIVPEVFEPLKFDSTFIMISFAL